MLLAIAAYLVPTGQRRKKLSQAETWLWIAFIFACVIAVHPAIDFAIDQKWKLDDRIVWERSKRLSTWGRMQRLFCSTVDNFKFNRRMVSDYRMIRRMAWAKYFRSEITFVDAIKMVETWAEKNK